MDTDEQPHCTSSSHSCSNDSVGRSNFSLLLTPSNSCTSQSNYSNTGSHTSNGSTDSTGKSCQACSSCIGCDCRSSTTDNSSCSLNHISGSDNKTTCSLDIHGSRCSINGYGKSHAVSCPNVCPQASSKDINPEGSSSSNTLMGSQSDCCGMWSGGGNSSSQTCPEERVELSTAEALSTHVLMSSSMQSVERSSSPTSSTATLSTPSILVNADCNSSSKKDSSSIKSSNESSGGVNESSSTGNKTPGSSRYLTPVSTPTSSRESNVMSLRTRLKHGSQNIPSPCLAAEGAAAAGLRRTRRGLLWTEVEDEQEDAAVISARARAPSKRRRRAVTAHSSHATKAAVSSSSKALKTGLSVERPGRRNESRVDEEEDTSADENKEHEQLDRATCLKQGKHQMQQEQPKSPGKVISSSPRNITTTRRVRSNDFRGETDQKEDLHQEEYRSRSKEAADGESKGKKMATLRSTPSVCSYSLRRSLRKIVASSPFRRIVVPQGSSLLTEEAAQRSTIKAPVATGHLTRAAAARLLAAKASALPQQAAACTGRRDCNNIAAVSPSAAGRRGVNISGAARREDNSSRSRNSHRSRSHSGSSRSRSGSSNYWESSSTSSKTTSINQTCKSGNGSRKEVVRTRHQPVNTRSRRERSTTRSIGKKPANSSGSPNSGSVHSTPDSSITNGVGNTRSRRINNGNSNNNANYDSGSSSRRMNPRRACRTGDPVPCGLEWTRRLVAAAKEKAAVLAWSAVDSPSMRELLKVRQEPQVFVGLGLYLEKPLRTCCCSIWQTLEQQQQQQQQQQELCPQQAASASPADGKSVAAEAAAERAPTAAEDGGERESVATGGPAAAAATVETEARGPKDAAEAGRRQEAEGRGAGVTCEQKTREPAEEAKDGSPKGRLTAVVGSLRVDVWQQQSEQNRYGSSRKAGERDSSSNSNSSRSSKEQEATFTAQNCAAKKETQEQMEANAVSEEKRGPGSPLTAPSEAPAAESRVAVAEFESTTAAVAGNCASGEEAAAESAAARTNRSIGEIERVTKKGGTFAEKCGEKMKKDLLSSTLLGDQMSSRRSSSYCNSPSSRGSLSSSTCGETITSNRHCTRSNSIGSKGKNACGCSEGAGGFRVLCFRGDVVLSPHNDRSTAPLISAEEKQLIYDPHENPGIEPALHLSPAFTLSSLEIPFSFQLQASRFLREGREEDVKAIYANHYCAKHCSAFFDINANGTPCIVTRPGAEIPAGPFGVFYGWSRSSSFPCAQVGCGHVCQPRCSACFSAEKQWRKCWRMHRRLAVFEAPPAANAEEARGGSAYSSRGERHRRRATITADISQQDLHMLTLGGRESRRGNGRTPSYHQGEQQQPVPWDGQLELVPPLCFSSEEEEEEAKEESYTQDGKKGEKFDAIVKAERKEVKGCGVVQQTDKTQEKRHQLFPCQRQEQPLVTQLQGGEHQQQHVPAQQPQHEEERRGISAQKSRFPEKEPKKEFVSPTAAAECKYEPQIEGTAATVGRDSGMGVDVRLRQREERKEEETQHTRHATAVAGSKATLEQNDSEETITEKNRDVAALIPTLRENAATAADEDNAEQSALLRRDTNRFSPERSAGISAEHATSPQTAGETDTEPIWVASPKSPAARHARLSPSSVELEKANTLFERGKEVTKHTVHQGEAAGGWGVPETQGGTTRSSCTSVYTGRISSSSSQSCLHEEHGSGSGESLYVGERCACCRSDGENNSARAKTLPVPAIAVSGGIRMTAPVEADKTFSGDTRAQRYRETAEDGREVEQRRVSSNIETALLSSSGERQILRHRNPIGCSTGDDVSELTEALAVQSKKNLKNTLAGLSVEVLQRGITAASPTTAAALEESAREKSEATNVSAHDTYEEEEEEITDGWRSRDGGEAEEGRTDGWRNRAGGVTEEKITEVCRPRDSDESEEERTAKWRDTSGNSRVMRKAEGSGSQKRVQRVWGQQEEGKRRSGDRATDYSVQGESPRDSRESAASRRRPGADIVATVQAAVAILRAAAVAAEIEKCSHPPCESTMQPPQRRLSEITQQDDRAEPETGLSRAFEADPASLEAAAAALVHCYQPQQPWGRKRQRSQKLGGQEEVAATAATLGALSVWSRRFVGAESGCRSPTEAAAPSTPSNAAATPDARPSHTRWAPRLLGEEIARRMEGADAGPSAADIPPPQVLSRIGRAAACAVGRRSYGAAASSFLPPEEQSNGQRRLQEQQQRNDTSRATSAAAVSHDQSTAIRAPVQQRPTLPADRTRSATAESFGAGYRRSDSSASTCQKQRAGDVALIEAAALLNTDAACSAAFAALATVLPLASPAYLHPLPPLLPPSVGRDNNLSRLAACVGSNVCGSSSCKCSCTNRCVRSCCCSCCNKNITTASWRNATKSCSANNHKCGSPTSRRAASYTGDESAGFAARFVSKTVLAEPVSETVGGCPYGPSSRQQTATSPAAVDAAPKERGAQLPPTATLLVDAATRLLLSLGATASAGRDNNGSNGAESSILRW